MYLSDNQLRAKVPEMALVCEHLEHTFDPEQQVQPCSLDLRLSNVFWEPVRRKVLDLRSSSLLELAPRRYWKKRVLEAGESITLGPGKLLLGRTYEEFRIPTDCAGKIEGRSSFARLGLGVHCSGDFINPNYRGRMTLQLFNYGPTAIRLFPYLPICQLVLVQLSSVPTRLYGSKELESKYTDDDGGPSYWWRDKRIKRLQTTFRSVDVSLEMQERILRRVGPRDPEIFERFEKFVTTTMLAQRENADALLETFIKSEDRLRRWDAVLNGLAYAVFPALASAMVGTFLARPFTWIHYGIWVATVMSLVPFITVLRTPKKEYLRMEDLHE